MRDKEKVFFGGASAMKKSNPWVILGVITAIAAIVASITTAVLMLEKKRKEDEELEHYIDCSIQ